MSVEKKIKELLYKKDAEQLTEAAEAQPMQGSSQKATFETMPGLAGSGKAASAKMSKDGSKSASVSVSGDKAQPRQGDSKDASFSEMDEDDENPGAKSAASVSKDTSLRPTMGSEAQQMQGDSKKATYTKAQYHEEAESDESEVIAEVSIKDELSSIFGEDLSEEFRAKATSIFEAAVIARVNSEMETIAEKLEEQNALQLQEFKETIVEKVDGYLSYVVEQWMSENEIAIDSGLRNEVTEEFITGLKTLFKESYIEVPEEKYDVVDELAQTVDTLKSELDESIEDNIELAKQLVEMKKEQVLAQTVEGLADTEADKLRKLVEGVEFETEELFAEKVAVIKENYFPKETKKTAEQTLVEETGTDQPMEVSDTMSHYMKAISRTVKSR